MSVLVTGGAGFIGSHLVDALIDKGAHVKVVDSLIRGDLSNIAHCCDKIEFVEGDLAKRPVAYEATRSTDVCFHLAATVGGVQFMASHPAEIFKSVCIDHNVIDACWKMGVERLLYTSSACVYPVSLQKHTSQRPLREEDAYSGEPDTVYGWVKMLGEIQCRAYHRAYGMKIAIVRPFNPYGERESFDPDDSHVIPALIRKAVDREDPFVVWGDGTTTRSFEYVGDTVEGMILAAENTVEADPINLGGSQTTRIRELAELILKLTDYKATIHWDKSKPQGVRSRKANFSKPRKLLGWTPKTPLREGLHRTIKWYKEQRWEK
jgi:nucleoside-diphosphate-sugar epimerase